MSGLSNWLVIKSILGKLGRPFGRVVYTDCPFCFDRHDVERSAAMLDLDERTGKYLCRNCGRTGTLEQLDAIAEGVFLSEHRTSLREMTARPGVERGGGQMQKRGKPR